MFYTLSFVCEIVCQRWGQVSSEEVPFIFLSSFAVNQYIVLCINNLCVIHYVLYNPSYNRQFYYECWNLFWNTACSSYFALWFFTRQKVDVVFVGMLGNKHFFFKETVCNCLFSKLSKIYFHGNLPV